MLHGEVADNDVSSLIAQCLKVFPELEGAPSMRSQEADSLDPLDVLMDSNAALRSLAGAKSPEMKYTEDFALSEKARLAARDQVANATGS